jgi:amino acid adenylation domain-containing protein
MLYHSRYTTDPEVYFLQLSCRLDGDLDAAAFERAWQQVLDRHTALRTSFHWRELDRPLQVVHRQVAVPFESQDWRALAPDEQAERLERLLAEDRRRGFDLARPPLLRLALCRLADARYQLVWSFHHLLFDGWSMPLVIQEVFAFYAAARRGEELQLPRPRPYRDFILWLQRQDMAAAEAFWRRTLAGFTAPTPLVLGAPMAGAPEDGDVGRIHLWLGGPLFAGLQELGRRRGLTLSTLVQGAWAVLLARSSREEDVVFGVTSAGRPADLPGSSDMVGLFINTLPVRVAVPPAEPLLPWLQRLQGDELRMREHEHSPLVRIQGWSGVPRGLPLFESIVVFEGFAVETSLAEDQRGDQNRLSIGDVRHVQKTNFPLALNASPQGESLRLRLTWDRHRFAAPDALRALSHLETLLAAMVEDPERRLGELPLLAAAERHQLQVEWNDAPGAGRTRGATLLERIVAQAQGAPDAVAIVHGEARLTYGELAARAAHVGRRLQGSGLEGGLEVGQGIRVGLALERSPDLVVGLLGILAAGGTYVPIDPGYPAERRDFMRQDARLAVVVDAEWLGRASAAPQAPAGLQPPSLSGRECVPERPLYVIYTSGSTGQPKGAVVHQGAFSSLVDWYVGELGLTAADCHLLLSSASFDLTQKNFFAPLLVGAELHLAPSAYDPAELRTLVERHGITGLNCTPSAFYPLAEEGDPAALASLRAVVLGGEPIALGRLDRWRRSTTGRSSVINSYGPTECTDVVAFYRLAPTDADTPVPLGRPVPGARLWIAGAPGSDLEPAPIGVAGELWIGGSCVGGGYLGDAARTALQFRPAPYPESPGARAYRTGDLARRLPGGEIEYLGRTDHQVKVRGFRIELGEIEAALGTHPALREAAVAARGETLVGYVVAHGVAPSDSDLRSFLASRLPEPLLPGIFVTLPALPLTPSGKVDRRALPDPGRPDHRSDCGDRSERSEPAGALEIYLAGLFRDVLKLAAGVEVSAEDDFFALGGHSIAAAVLINRLQDKLGAILYAVALFDAPTVSRLAAYLIDNYPEAVARVFGETALGSAAARLVPTSAPRIDRARIDALRRAIAPLPPLAAPAPAARARLAQPAVFVLSPPRSGSTLLRVMLAGHPRLFAPPELELLSFDTLAERRAAFPGRNAFWLEGTVRAVMEVRGIAAEDAEAELARRELEGMTTRDFYRELQEWIGDRVLVDKTPSYALDGTVLARAEEVFEGARYIHLLRHPYGMIHSFEEAKLEQVFFRHPHAFSRRELAELIWLVSQENILAFLAKVPRDRQLRIRFEDLLARPVPVLEEICAFLGLDFHPAMAAPYKRQGAGDQAPGRMTDGIHAWSRMLGDVKFLQHAKVDPAVAERWRDGLRDLVPGDETVALAESLGYAVEPLRRAAEAGRSAIPRRPADTGPLPLSYSQERLWFIDQLQPGSVAYNLPAAVRLRGDLDPAAFHDALAEVIRRHEALRTTFGFAAGEGGPVQRVAPELPPELPRIDLRTLPVDVREAEVRRLALADARRPFDLAAGPLFRAALLATAVEPAEHVALLNLHHIVADGHSIGVLLREIATLYAAFSGGRPSPLPELPVQYPDYALWQRTWLTGEVLAAQTAYWTEALRGTPVLELPTDLPRPPVRSERGGLVRRRLPAPVSAGLGALAEREKATRFMVLLAGWGALLARTARQSDLAIGVAVANRTRPEIEGLIGFFVNTLVLRLSLAGDRSRPPDFRTLVAQARQTALGAYAHQDLPFEKVVDAVQPPRDTSRSPLFQVMLAFQNTDGAARAEKTALSGLALEPLAVDSGSVKFDLTLSVSEGTDGELALRAGYRTDLFLAPTVARHLGHLETLLAAAVADPERPWTELPLLAPAERHQLLVEWNDTAGNAPGVAAGRSLFELFAAAAAARPDAPAVIAQSFFPPGPTLPVAPAVLGASEPSRGGPTRRECRLMHPGMPPAPAVLTYGELARRVDLLATRLAGLGVGPEVRVGILLPRSADAVTAILAVLAVGGAYLPLDPSHPADRRAFQLRDAGAALVLTRRDLLAAFPETAVPALCLDDRPIADAFHQASHVRVPTPAPDPDQLAYVLYTSGSTGVPSGVLMPQRGALNLVADARRRLAVGPGSRVLQLAPLGFDVSVAELFVPLASGATLCLIADEARRDPALLAEALADLGVDRAFVTPAFFTALPESSVPDLWASVGGEAFSRELAERWGRGRHLFNNYGPTEAAVYATSRRVDTDASAVPGHPAGPSIGRPIGNVRACLLDARLHPVAIGVAGEICLGGAALARGYAGRPDRTAERFVPDPFADQPGERLYRTGDLARRLPTGEIDFLGRIDDQIKVRGFRIEPGEIEAALLRHPAVRQAAVVVRGTAAAERHLVAYVAIPETPSASASEPAPDPSALRRFLAASLPEPMVPAVFVVLPALPLTSHGKVDRRALPDPQHATATAEPTRPRAQPESPVERLLAPIWEEVLGRPEIGADEDFFALGGTSLQAAILVHHLEKRLGAYVYVVALFDAPTIAGLARYLERHYPDAIAKAIGPEATAQAAGVEAAVGATREEPTSGRVDAAELQRFPALIPPLPRRAQVPSRRPRRALFVLSPPRSGSTLLRVLLGGHPDLFAPPELELLGFNTLSDRRAAFSGRYAFWAEGLVRAVMELDGATAEAASATVAAYEQQSLSVRELYADLEDRLDGRLLVDKTPSYALDPAVLARAEEDFEQPLYLHLLRHPHGMIRSFVQARLDQVFFRIPHDYPRRTLAELIWLASQRHIRAHLSGVAAARQLTVRFEDLVRAPEAEMRRVCGFLGLDFHPAMLDPYEAGGRRMTDGVHALSKMLGDVKFHEHAAIDPAVAESWKTELAEDFLGEETWRTAETLGYPRPSTAAPSTPLPSTLRPGRAPLVPLVPEAEAGPGRPLFLVHPAGGDVHCYRDLARRLGPERPVYGLASPLLSAEDGIPNLEQRAAVFVEAMIGAQPEGPYAVGGWSLGGVIAWEIVQQLEQRGKTVELLVLLDSHAPDPESPRADQAEILANLAAGLPASPGHPAITAEALRRLPEPERLRVVFAAARQAGALPEGLGEEQAGALLRAGEAEVDAMRAYQPQPYAGPVLLVRAARGGGAADLGWGALAEAGLETVALDANHSGLLVEPALTELAGVLRARLDSSRWSDRNWSGRRDLNPGPPEPHSSDDLYASLRIITQICAKFLQK